MGPILYERYIKPYTEKQWGRPARELSAQWAPRRVSVRWDNDPYLFPDHTRAGRPARTATQTSSTACSMPR